MKRRQFIKTTSLSGLAIATSPQLVFFQNLISTEELLGKGSPQLVGDEYKLKEEAHLAFTHMKAEALKEGILIQIVSGYRDFEHQKGIWERKFNHYRNQGLSDVETIQKIIEYSTIPGTSRHHWGTDIDIVDGNVHPPRNMLRADHFHRDGSYIYLRKWMEKYANSFGFYLVYTSESNRKGFKYEPWHYSYRPLSKPYLKAYKNLNLIDILKKEKISGNKHFDATFLSNYRNENILDINPELL